MKIELSNISKSIQDSLILKEINLELESSHIYGLYGANGSGKTMLLRVITGLMKADNGQVIINGKEIGKEQDFPDSLGFIIENPSFLDAYTGFKNLQLIAGLKNIANDSMIADALERVGLDSKDKRKYKKYSLGMKQRLGIAAAIMEKPELIVLDEPTNALDEDAVDLLESILIDEKQRGALIIIACHDFEFLSRLADTILYMKRGKLSKEQIDEN